MYDLILDYNSLLNDVMITNATYLGISVLVVLALGGISGAAVYFTSIKPYQQRISKASTELASLQNEIKQLVKENKEVVEELDNKYVEIDSRYAELSDQIESLTDETKLEINKLTKNLDEKISRNEWFSKYDKGELWKAMGRPEDAFDALVEGFNMNTGISVTKSISILFLKNIISENLVIFKESASMQDKLKSLKIKLVEYLETEDDKKIIERVNETLDLINKTLNT